MAAKLDEEGLQRSIELLGTFSRNNLRGTISGIENEIRGLNEASIAGLLSARSISPSLLTAAAQVKRAASQIDVMIHALGILKALPHILVPGEVIASVSLGAGNTGRSFDLESNRRVAEFKFINWRGGSESIRQNGIFKDFFDLASAETTKEKYLYLLGTNHALKFMCGGRSLSSVLSKNDATRRRFEELFGQRYITVGQYFTEHQRAVQIVDLSPWLPELLAIQTIEIDDALEV